MSEEGDGNFKVSPSKLTTDEKVCRLATGETLLLCHLGILGSSSYNPSMEETRGTSLTSDL